LIDLTGDNEESYEKEKAIRDLGDLLHRYELDAIGFDIAISTYCKASSIRPPF
jgi:hypothetical protein